MKLEEIRKYRGYLIALKTVNEELELAYYPISSPASKEVIGGKVSARSPSNPTAVAVNEINRLKAKKEELERKIELIDSFIETIDNIYIANVIHLHYRRGFSWNKTANYIYGFPQGDTCRKAVKRYFKEEEEDL